MCSKNCYSHWHKEQGKRTYITWKTQHTPPTHPPPTRQKPVLLEKFQLWEWHKGHITLHQGQALNWILMFPLTILDIKKICSTLHTSWWGFWICCYNCGRGEKKPSQNHTTYDSNNHQCCICWTHAVSLGTGKQNSTATAAITAPVPATEENKCLRRSNSLSQQLAA